MSGAQRQMPVVVVAGVGNPLRGDDAAAWRVAEAVERRWGHQGVRLLVAQQVLPEWAASLAEADVVYFVDAAAGSERIALDRLEPSPGDTAPAGTHALEPPAILRMALDLFGRAPEAYLLSIPATDFGFTERLSATTSQAVAAAIRTLDECLAARLR